MERVARDPRLRPAVRVGQPGVVVADEPDPPVERLARGGIGERHRRAVGGRAELAAEALDRRVLPVVGHAAVPAPAGDLGRIEAGVARVLPGGIDGQLESRRPHVLVGPRVVRRLEPCIGERLLVEVDDLRGGAVRDAPEDVVPAVLVERAGIEVGQVEPGRLDPFGQVEERGAADPLLDVGARHPQHVRQVVRRDLGRDLLGLRVLRDVLQLDGELGMGGVDRLDGGLEGRQLLRRHADLQSQADRTGRRRRARAGADDDGHEQRARRPAATIAFGARWSSAWHLPLGDGGQGDGVEDNPGMVGRARVVSDRTSVGLARIAPGLLVFVAATVLVTTHRLRRAVRPGRVRVRQLRPRAAARRVPARRGDPVVPATAGFPGRHRRDLPRGRAGRPDRARGEPPGGRARPGHDGPPGLGGDRATGRRGPRGGRGAHRCGGRRRAPRPALAIERRGDVGHAVGGACHHGRVGRLPVRPHGTHALAPPGRRHGRGRHRHALGLRPRGRADRRGRASRRSHGLASRPAAGDPGRGRRRARRGDRPRSGRRADGSRRRRRHDRPVRGGLRRVRVGPAQRSADLVRDERRIGSPTRRRAGRSTSARPSRPTGSDRPAFSRSGARSGSRDAAASRPRSC